MAHLDLNTELGEAITPGVGGIPRGATVEAMVGGTIDRSRTPE